MRFDKLTTKFQQALNDAQSLALGNDNGFIEPQHLLAALLAQQDGGTASLLARAGVPLPRLQSALKASIDRLPSVSRRDALKVDWSLGKGVWASVPWIAVMDARETNSTQTGLYIVLLVSRDLSAIHLCLMQGTTELVNEYKQSGALPILRARSDQYRALVPDLASAGFRLDGDIDLGAEGWRAQSYEAGCVAHMPFTADDLPSDVALEHAMEALVTAYETVLARRDAQAAPTPDALPPYTIDDALKGLFLEREEFERVLAVWKDKKNLVL